MKKIFMSLLVLVFAGTGLSAQGIKLGAKLGLNMNKISGQSFKDGFDLGYHVGGFAEINLTKKIGIQPEVFWNRASTDRTNFNALYSTVVNTANTTKSIKLDYLSIPVLLKFKLVGPLVLNAGPQYSILLSQDKTLLQSGKEAFKSGDFSLVLGGQVNLIGVAVYARYNIGLQNINDISGVTQTDNWKSQQLQAGIAIRL